MLTRRGFLKGFLASVAAGALVKNGVIQPEQVIDKPEPWTIDMAANTWRDQVLTFRFERVDKLWPTEWDARADGAQLGIASRLRRAPE